MRQASEIHPDDTPKGVGWLGARLGMGRRRRAPAMLVVPALATAAVVNLPLVYLGIRASQNGFDSWLDAVSTPFVGGLITRTLLLVIGVVALAILVAVPLAWLVTRTDLPGRRLWAVLGAMPLVFPSYVSAYALVAVLGPRGFAQSWLRVERLPDIAYGYSGALLTLALFTYPYIYLPLVGTLRSLDPALEDSSRALGVGRWRTFFAVVLPQLRLPILAGALLVALYTLSDFGGVAIVRYNTFTLAVYNAYTSLHDRTMAASLAVVLVLLTLVLLALEAFLGRRNRPTRQRPSRPPELIPLGRWRWPVLAGIGSWSVLTVGMPLGVVTYWGIRGLFAGRDLERAGNAVIGSLTVSLIAAVCAAVLALPIAVWSVRHRNQLSRVTERLSYAGYALPGLVIALAMVFFATRAVPMFYQTLPILVLAYVIRFLPEATASTRASLTAVAPAFEEAARSLGQSPWRVLRTVTLPMILPGITAGAGLVFLTSMKELPATLLLQPTGYRTLATDIWTFASEGFYTSASLPALALLIATAPPLYYLTIRPALQRRTSRQP
ncbi:MAG: iron ABC transporter permease [Acidobacteriota bacterium]